ncbi:MAG TPA: sialate O-acetylesterase [Lacunisphaera sp.]|nr:sialate O-acetylesterase [Lacunisphaera sp.]
MNSKFVPFIPTLRAAALSLLVANLAVADVRLPAIIGDHMVIQREAKAPLWGWADPGETVRVQGSWSTDAVTASAGADGRWRVDLPTPAAGGPYTVTIAGKNEITLTDILVGEVWLASGQSNMQMPLKHPTPGYDVPVLNNEEEIRKADHPDVRLFLVPYTAADEPVDGGKGEWKRCAPDSVERFSAIGYFFARTLNQDLGVPVGMVAASQGASALESWTSHEVLAAHQEYAPILERYQQAMRNLPEKKAQYEKDIAAWKALSSAAQARTVQPWRPYGDYKFCAPSTLWNGMIHPVVPFAMRGVIFYQGEENTIWTLDYHKLFSRMVQSWRDAWANPDLFFDFAQLSSYDVNRLTPIGRYWVEWHPNGAHKATISDESWARVQEAQLKSLDILRTGMAVTIDIGAPTNIHPPAKQEVARRLALNALAKVYGRDVVYSGPIYESMRVTGGKAVIRFKTLQSQLAAKGGKPLVGFKVAGADRIFHPADARIDGDTVVVVSQDVPHPVAVRYAWGSYPENNLINEAGLPASPFRTDSW